jgi:uncharacterized membrane protein
MPDLPKRLTSIDTVRGLIMIVMALDHARDFLGFKAFNATDLAQTTVPFFLTRWVTHFCAPGFMFLAGTAAFLSSRRKSKPELTRFLVSRGLWLVFAELTIINFAWSFTFDSPGLMVIWALGWSMVFLAAMIWLPLRAIAAISVLIIASHNLFDGLTLKPETPGEWVLVALHQQLNPVRYPLVPWVAVMSLGYAFGPIFEFDAARRRRVLVLTGSLFVALFIVIRGLNGYGDASHWSVQKDTIFTLFSFVNATKYPPSLLYLLMTLGPLLLALAAAESVHAKVLLVFGRVPFFYYSLHLFLLHAAAVIVGVAQGFEPTAFVTTFFKFPPAYGVSLWAVYVGWAAAVGALYLPCRWFADLKARRREWWLSYL